MHPLGDGRQRAGGGRGIQIEVAAGSAVEARDLHVVTHEIDGKRGIFVFVPRRSHRGQYRVPEASAGPDVRLDTSGPSARLSAPVPVFH